MTFSEWLKTRRGRNTRIGDLAGDAARDRQWPADAETLDAFQCRLVHAGACREARATLTAAWRAYARAQRRRDAAPM